MQIVFALLLFVTGLSSSGQAAQVQPPLFDVTCMLRNLGREALSLRDLPEPLSRELRSRLLEADRLESDVARRFPQLDIRPGAIADHGEQFNPTDTGGGIKRRFSRAGDVNGTWFVWYEHGGIAPLLQVVLFKIESDGSVALIAADQIWRGSPTALFAGPGNNAIPITDVCSRTEDLLAGRATAYSRGW